MLAAPKPYLGRKSLRLPGFDYARAGAYFVTIVTQGRLPLFGAVVAGGMRLNAAGEMVSTVCADMPHKVPGMRWGLYQIMPNHFNAIIELNYDAGADPNNSFVGATPRDAPVGATPRGCPGQTQRSAPTGHHPLTLGDVVGRFKSLTTRLYIDGVHGNHWPPFNQRLRHLP
jgi:putative transposase